MFTAGCCIICLSIHNVVREKLSLWFFNHIVYKHAKM